MEALDGFGYVGNRAVDDGGDTHIDTLGWLATPTEAALAGYDNATRISQPAPVPTDGQHDGPRHRARSADRRVG
jgi:hypothetical protein